MLNVIVLNVSHDLFIVMLNVVMLNVVMLSAVMMNVAMLSVVCAECRYAECRGAKKYLDFLPQKSTNFFFTQFESILIRKLL